MVDKLAAANLAQSILKSAETEAEFRRRLDLVEAILVNKFPQLSTEEILKMLDLKTADVTQTRFYQEVFQVGQQEGEAALVLRLLARRCGVLSPDQEKKVRDLEVERLEALGVALLDFGGMPDLDLWLMGLRLSTENVGTWMQQNS